MILKNFFKVLGVILLGISLMFIIQIPLIILLQGFVEANPNLGMTIVVFLYNSLVFGALWLIINKLLKDKMSNFGFKLPVFDSNLLFLSVFAPAIVLSIIFLLTPGKFVPVKLSFTFETLFFQAIVASGLYAPIVEEMIFHGLIYHVLKKRFSFFQANVITAIIFALSHAFNQGYTPLKFLLFCLGSISLAILFRYMTEVNGTIWYAAFAHFIWNGIVATFLYNISDKPDNMTLINYITENGNELITGGSGGALLSVITPIVYLSISYLLHLKIKKQSS